jgi:hypothetical protein
VRYNLGRGDGGGGEAIEKGREEIELSTGSYLSLVLLVKGVEEVT